MEIVQNVDQSGIDNVSLLSSHQILNTVASQLQLPSDSPTVCEDIIAIAEAEELTIVDAALDGDIDTSDLSTFLEYARDTDSDLDPGLIQIVRIVKPLLAERDKCVKYSQDRLFKQSSNSDV